MEPDYGGAGPPCWIIGGGPVPPGPPSSYSTVTKWDKVKKLFAVHGKCECRNAPSSHVVT